MEYELMFHECESDCSFTHTHQQLSNTVDSVTWNFRLPSFDDHVLAWVLSKCKCEDCILINYFVPWITKGVHGN